MRLRPVWIAHRCLRRLFGRKPMRSCVRAPMHREQKPNLLRRARNWFKPSRRRQVARALLAQFLGVQPQQITLSAPKLLQLPPEQPVAPLDAAQNPSGGGTECAGGTKEGRASDSRKVIFPPIFCAGLGVCAWNRCANSTERDLADSTAWLPTRRTMRWDSASPFPFSIFRPFARVKPDSPQRSVPRLPGISKSQQT